MGSKLYNRFGSIELATQFLYSMVASANLIYEPQMNIVLTPHKLYIQSTHTGAPAWDQGK